VSRIHAEFSVLPDGQILLIDNKSRNGTAVIRNGRCEPVSEARVGRDDQVRFGEVVLRVNDLLESLGSKLPPPPAKSQPADPLHAYSESLAAVLRRKWRESIIGAMVLGAVTLLAIDPQSQTFHFIVGIMGSVIASMVFSLLQQFWQRK
jgi:pSer/pThr/pTyr-binding forkhead associated (FHA) protein